VKLSFIKILDKKMSKKLNFKFQFTNILFRFNVVF